MGVGLCSKKNLYKNVNILVDEPDPQSPASGIKLWRMYYKKTIKQEKVLWKQYSIVKRRLIAKNKSSLSCSYCHKKLALKGGGEDSVTIDHIIPISKGGSILCESNMVICCKACNSKKGDTLLTKKENI